MLKIINNWTILFFMISILSCENSVEPNNEWENLDCENLKTGIINVNKEVVEFEINKLVSDLEPAVHSNERFGHEENLNLLINRLNTQCNEISAELICYACIETNPPQSEILVRTDSSGISVKRVIDILTPGNAALSCVRIHEYYNVEPFYYDSLSLEELYQLIAGKWEWTYSIIMQRNIHPPDNRITPETAGYTMQRNFKSDGQVDFYINEQLKETHSYEIKRFKVLPSDKGSVTLIYIDDYPAQLLFFNPDSIMMGTGWSDGIDEYFSRKSE